MKIFLGNIFTTQYKWLKSEFQKLLIFTATKSSTEQELECRGNSENDKCMELFWWIYMDFELLYTISICLHRKQSQAMTEIGMTTVSKE